jgi:uncharacterized protein (TIGR03086 family)
VDRAAPAHPLDHLGTAARAAQGVIEAVPDDAWEAPSPCGGWSAAQVADHLVDGTERVAAALAGPTGEVGMPSSTSRSERHRAAAAAMAEGFRRPGALETPLRVPAGELPGAVVARLRTVEALVHGWDLAVATGVVLDPPSDVVEGALDFSRSMLQRLPEDRRPFAAPVRVADDAAPLDRLVALLGRDPGVARR